MGKTVCTEVFHLGNSLLGDSDNELQELCPKGIFCKIYLRSLRRVLPEHVNTLKKADKNFLILTV